MYNFWNVNIYINTTYVILLYNLRTVVQTWNKVSSAENLLAELFPVHLNVYHRQFIIWLDVIVT